MKEVAIKIEGIGKKYTIGKQKDDSLRSAVSNVFKNSSYKGEDFWALKDVSFEINKGDVIGIVGKNGAGKSTLLKILSQITKPTEGRIEINGRVASLLEVGTGFHPELTGRENIYLNGTILGMTRKEVTSKFDEIVEFSGIKKFIDTPVKRYSSGQYVRLAFAVAAHLEPEILIIDEVLAVGDAEFQKKCLGKMKDVAEHGRTVLFVSHNISAISNLCSKCVMLENGHLKTTGETQEVISQYLNSSQEISIDETIKVDGFSINKIEINSFDKQILPGSSFEVNFHYTCSKEFISPAFMVNFNNTLNVEILRFSTLPISGFKIRELHENGKLTLRVNSCPFVPGEYYINFGFAQEKSHWHFLKEHIVKFTVEDIDVYNSGTSLKNVGVVWADHNWTNDIEIVE